MRRLVRENAVCALAAAAASVTIGWLGLYGFAWNDYEIEAKPAFEALAHGHVLDFLRLAPAYGGSLVERAPFALLPGLWGGGQLAVYRMVAVPCLLAGALLGVWLCARMRTAGASPLWQALALAVCVANPLTLGALELGHPEELLGACLCVGAVLLAARGQAIWAGVLLGLAIANKEWALVAAGPALLALPRDAEPSLSNRAPSRAGALLRARALGRCQAILCLMSATAVTAVVLAPLVLVSSGGFASSTRAAASPATNIIFKPWQVWWFLGHHGALALGPGDVHNPSYRVGPTWVSAITHPLVLASALVIAGALWLRNRRTALSEQQALLALALVLLLRCVLDTWDEIYYLLPFVLALLAWELSWGARRPPVLALASTVLAWTSFQWLPSHGASPDAQAALFLAWTLPLAAMLALRLYATPRGTELLSAPVKLPPVLDEEPLIDAQHFSHPWATSI
jgi:hypothetical protein